MIAATRNVPKDVLFMSNNILAMIHGLFLRLGNIGLFSFELEASSVMVAAQCLLSWLPQQVLPKGAARDSIILKYDATLSQNGYQKFHDVLMRSRIAHVGDIETVHVGLNNPLSVVSKSADVFLKSLGQLESLTCSIMSATISGVPTGVG